MPAKKSRKKNLADLSITSVRSRIRVRAANEDSNAKSWSDRVLYHLDEKRDDDDDEDEEKQQRIGEAQEIKLPRVRQREYTRTKRRDATRWAQKKLTAKSLSVARIHKSNRYGIPSSQAPPRYIASVPEA